MASLALEKLGEKYLPVGYRYNLHAHNKLFSDKFTARYYTLPKDLFLEKFINEGYKMCEFNEKTKQWESVGAERTAHLLKKRQVNFQTMAKWKQLATLGEKYLPASSKYIHKHNTQFSDTFTAHHYTLPDDDFLEKFINEGYKMCEFDDKTNKWESVGAKRTASLVKERQEGFKRTRGTNESDKKEEHLRLQTALSGKEIEVAQLKAELENSAETARKMHLKTDKLLHEVVELRRAKAVAEARANTLEEELGALIYKSSHFANLNFHSSRGEGDENPPRSIAGTAEVRKARTGAGKIATPTASTSQLEKSKEAGNIIATSLCSARSISDTASCTGFKNPSMMTISERIDTFHKVHDLVKNREPFETVQDVIDAAKISRSWYEKWKKSVAEWEKVVAVCPAYGRARRLDKGWANIIAGKNNSNAGDDIPDDHQFRRSDDGKSPSQSTSSNHACPQQDRSKRRAEEIEATTSAEINTATISTISVPEKVTEKIKVLQKHSQRAHQKNDAQTRMHEEQRENEQSAAIEAKQEANQETSTSEVEKSKAAGNIIGISLCSAKSISDTSNFAGFKNPAMMTINERIDAFHKVQDVIANKEPYEKDQDVLDAVKISRSCYENWKKSVAEWEKVVTACPAYGHARRLEKDWANIIAGKNNSNAGDDIPDDHQFRQSDGTDEGNSPSQSTTSNHACPQQDRSKRRAEEIEATTSAEINTATTSSISELQKVTKKMKVLQKQSHRAHENNSEHHARIHEEQRENEESVAKGGKQEANQEMKMPEKQRKGNEADGDENDNNNSWTEEDWEILCRMLCDKIEEVQSKYRSLKNRKDHYKNRCLELTNQHGNEIEGASSSKKGGVQQGSADTSGSGEGSVTTKSKREDSDEAESVKKIQRTD